MIELGQESKLSIFSEVRTLQNHRKTLTSNPEVRTLQNHRKTLTSNPEVKITEKPRLPTHFKTNLDEPSDHTLKNRQKLKK